MRRTGEYQEGREAPLSQEGPLCRHARQGEEPGFVGEVQRIAVQMVGWRAHPGFCALSSHTLPASLGRYLGMITDTDKDMNFATVEYDDGEVEKNVIPKFIRFV